MKIDVGYCRSVFGETRRQLSEISQQPLAFCGQGRVGDICKCARTIHVLDGVVSHIVRSKLKEGSVLFAMIAAGIANRNEHWEYSC